MTACASSTLAAAPAAQDDSSLACLLDVFAAIKDPRSPHGRRYSLAACLALSTLAPPAGFKNPSQGVSTSPSSRGRIIRIS